MGDEHVVRVERRRFAQGTRWFDLDLSDLQIAGMTRRHLEFALETLRRDAEYWRADEVRRHTQHLEFAVEVSPVPDLYTREIALRAKHVRFVA
jgi:hypothetical protein